MPGTIAPAPAFSPALSDPIMRPSFRLIPLLAVLAIAGCDSSKLSDQDRAELQAGEVRIPLGETATLDGLSITFDAVVSDSRCPSDVECIWAGEATVTLRIDGTSSDVVVADPERTPEAGVRVGDVLVYAVALAPYPRQNDPSDATPVVAVSTVEAE